MTGKKQFTQILVRCKARISTKRYRQQNWKNESINTEMKKKCQSWCHRSNGTRIKWQTLQRCNEPSALKKPLNLWVPLLVKRNYWSHYSPCRFHVTTAIYNIFIHIIQTAFKIILQLWQTAPLLFLWQYDVRHHIDYDWRLHETLGWTVVRCIKTKHWDWTELNKAHLVHSPTAIRLGWYFFWITSDLTQILNTLE